MAGTVTTPAPGTAPRIRYQPALDGVRALAVVAVLFFHAGVPGFDGGYLGVSVFFTLSGYLITSLLIAEFDTKGTIDLPAFYGRRMRRLLPASVLTVGVIVVLSSITDWFDGVSSLRPQVIGSLFQVANWVLLAGDGSYQELLAETSGTPSPLEHFWSLAIEEQFYWLWPLAMLFLLRRVGPHRSRTVAIGALTALAAVAAPVIAQVWGADAAYWATPARLAEILVGAFLAMLLARRLDLPSWLAWLAPLGLIVLSASVVLFPTVGGPAYEGALPLVAVVSGALLVGLQVDGPVRAGLSIAPLVFVGKISYGVYLYHWPIYVVLDADRAGFDGAPLVFVRLALTFVVAVASYFFFEQPIRHATKVGFRPTLIASLGATTAVAVASFVLVPTALGNYWESDDQAAEAAAIETDDTTPLVPIVATTAPTSPVTTPSDESITTDESTPVDGSTATDPPGTGSTSVPSASATTVPAPTTVPPLPELARPVRALMVGDSTAEAIGAGLVSWAAANPDLAQVQTDVERGCGFVVVGERAVGEGWEQTPDRCVAWVDDRVPAQVAELTPDVVVLMVTPWDVIDHRFDGSTESTPFDPEFEAELVEAYGGIVGDLVDAGVSSIVWVEPPTPNPLWMSREAPQADPARYEVVERVVTELQGQYPQLRILPFAAWHAAEGLDDDKEIRPDGVHWTPDVSRLISENYLGEQVIRAALGLPFSGPTN
ncbi:MAG: acyltransferase family protein [Ilumatobacter fluminis]|uniref:acyltransferase family protein n=1 Tax=Ilumatobacter fluminis TaxID=467091 RepID=UPI0032ED5742